MSSLSSISWRFARTGSTVAANHFRRFIIGDIDPIRINALFLVGGRFIRETVVLVMTDELYDEIVIDFDGPAKVPRFDEVKATQLAGRLLKLRGTGQMHYLKLIKLMYLIDREALVRWGWSMTGDRYVSMEHGQVLSGTYDLIRDEHFGDSYWKHFISPPLGEYEVKLVAEPETTELSEADLALVDEIYKRFGYLNRWRLRDYTHRLPEYRQTNGPSLDVDYASVLKAANKSDEEIRGILDDLQEIAELDNLAI